MLTAPTEWSAFSKHVLLWKKATHLGCGRGQWTLRWMWQKCRFGYSCAPEIISFIFWRWKKSKMTFNGSCLSSSKERLQASESSNLYFCSNLKYKTWWPVVAGSKVASITGLGTVHSCKVLRQSLPWVRAFPLPGNLQFASYSQMGRKLANSRKPYIMAGFTSWQGQSRKKEKFRRVFITLFESRTLCFLWSCSTLFFVRFLSFEYVLFVLLFPPLLDASHKSGNSGVSLECKASLV